MLKNRNISEEYIINNYLKKLNFNRPETFNFNNDAAFLNSYKNKKIIVTNDTILESVDFFKEDPPESIANKIITCNLSDISSMGSLQFAYTLSLGLPNYTKDSWLRKFTNKLLSLQKKYNFFLLGGDLSQSNKVIISSNFFGYVEKDKILKRTGSKINDDIWVTGNIGESLVGLKIKQKKIKINNLEKKYFLNKYLFPVHCPLGYKIRNYVTSSIDISDGFYGDLSKLINYENFGASLNIEDIPLSRQTKHLIKNRKITLDSLLSSGDDYELIFTANSKNSSIIKRISKKNNIKITNVGKIISKKGIYLDNKKIKITNKSFEHFS